MAVFVIPRRVSNTLTVDQMNEYGHDVRLARYVRKWTREQLAEESGITVEQINAIENGEASPEPVLEALQLIYQERLTTEPLAAFSVVIQPILAKIPEDQLPLVMAVVLDAIGRAAAGIELTKAPNLNVIASDITITPPLS